MKMLLKFFCLLALLFNSVLALGDSDPYSKEKLLVSVNSLAKRLPMQIDAVTTISAVALLDNKSIQYRYSLNKENAIQMAADEEKIPVNEFIRVATSRFGSIDKLLSVWSKTLLSKRIIASNCSNPDTRAWLNHGVTLIHTISDDQGMFLHEEVVTNELCN